MKPKFEIGQIVHRVGLPRYKDTAIINIYEVRTYKTKKVVKYLYEFKDMVPLWDEEELI